MDRGKKFTDHISYLKAREEEWERLCCCCGGCCGAFDDPCRHLKMCPSAVSTATPHKEPPPTRYYCEIYPKRFGTRTTVGGERFDCVSIKKVWNTRWPNDHFCTYKQYRASGYLRARSQSEKTLTKSK